MELIFSRFEQQNHNMLMDDTSLLLALWCCTAVDIGMTEHTPSIRSSTRGTYLVLTVSVDQILSSMWPVRSLGQRLGWPSTDPATSFFCSFGSSNHSGIGPSFSKLTHYLIGLRPCVQDILAFLIPTYFHFKSESYNIAN